MNRGPGSVNPNNPLVPFAQFDTLHFARFVILDDKTSEISASTGSPAALIRCISPSSATLTAMRMHFWATGDKRAGRLARNFLMLPRIRG